MNRALRPDRKLATSSSPGDAQGGRAAHEQEYTQMVNQRSRTALVTGCSSGIGRETALQLHRAGLVVYATARRPGTLTG
jgi:hypothetical protein